MLSLNSRLCDAKTSMPMFFQAGKSTALRPCHTSATDLPNLTAKLLALHIGQARHTVDEGVERTARMVVLCLIELAVGMVLLVIPHLSMVHLGRL